MPEYERLRPRDVHERVFRLVLRCYPRGFRDEFGDAMVEFFRDRLADARAHGRAGIVEAWISTLRDCAVQAIPAHVDGVRRAVRRALSPRPRAVVAARRKDWMLSSIVQDLRYGLRGMLRTPAFTALVITTLALGIGANAAIFSVVNGVLFKPLPFPNADRLISISLLEPYGSTISEPEFADFRRDAKTLDGVAAHSRFSASLTGDGADPERVQGSWVSDGFFGVIEVPPLLGRSFTPEEERSGGPQVVLLSHGLWQRRFGGDPAIVGRQIMVNGASRTVVGVMPPSFTYPSAGGAQSASQLAMWSPLRLRYDSLWTRNNHYLSVVARLAPGNSVATARAELNAMARRWKQQYTDTYSPDQPLEVSAVSLSDSLLGRTRPFLLALFGAVGFVLLIACVNVANLLLVRAEGRRKDLAIRTALGASFTRIVRQSLTESVMFSAVGAVLGILVGWWTLRALVGFAPPDIPRLDEVRIDGAVLLFTAAVAIVTGLAFGVAPAALAGRGDSSETLKEGGKTSSAAARSTGRARRRLVIAEIALAVITLSSAGLLLRSLVELQSIDLGFEPRGLLTMTVSPPASSPDMSVADRSKRAVAIHEQLLERVRAIPGVDDAAAAQRLPVEANYSSWSILVDGAPATTIAEAPSATPEPVTPDYFRTMRIGLVRGRYFTAEDHADASLVAIVNETMAKKLWPGRDPLAGTLRMFGDQAPNVTIVGIVRDVRAGGFSEDIPPTMYFPHAQSGRSAYFTPLSMNLIVRTSGDPTALNAAIRRTVRSVEPNAPVSREATMDRLLADSVGTRRFSTVLVLVFASLALVLAGIGVYGVISSTVSQRSFEIGLRMALGASRWDVVSMILGEGLRTGVLGAGAGLVVAVGSMHLLRAMFFGVQAWDPLVLATAVGLLLLVVVAAASIPAARATAVDPNRSLRAE